MNYCEIERKFLVKGEFRHLAISQSRICQGYLSLDPQRTVRIRINGGKGYITIKGSSGQNDMSRFEWEKEIPDDEAELLLRLCLPGVVEKVRYIVPVENLKYEVDVFFGENEGLVMAEVELESENQQVKLPYWIGTEVTGDRRYYNSYLAQNPYGNWPESERQTAE